MPGLASPAPTPQPPTPDAAPLRDLLEEIGRLLAAHPAPEAFYPRFLQLVLTALGGHAGAVWRRGPGNDLVLQYQTGREALQLETIPYASAAHAEALRLAGQRRQALCLPPEAGRAPAGGKPQLTNPTASSLFLAPILLEQEVGGFVEVWRQGATDARQARGLAHLLGEVAGLAAAYLHRAECQELRERQRLWEQLRAYGRRLHGSLDPREVAYLAANEGRRLLGCDQVAVAVDRAGKAEVLAVSGAPFIEPRGPLHRSLQELSEAVLAWGEKVVYTGTRDEALPPGVVTALDSYLAQSKSRVLTAVPLHDPRQKDDRRGCAVLIADCFGAEIAAAAGGADPLQARLEALTPDTASALYNAVQHQRVPLRWLSDALDRLRDGLRRGGLTRLAVVAGTVLLTAAVLALVPANLRLEARGELLPRDRQTVYSTLNGKVTELKAQHGQAVARGQELLLMEDLDLQLQIDQLAIKVSSAEQRLALLGQQLARATGNEERNTLTREMVNQEYEMRKAAAERDVLLQGSRNPRKTPVLAPLAGKVVTFDAQEQLVGKTVKPGDPLLRVARVQGPWEVELYVPEERVGAVRDGLDRVPGGVLDVVLLLASHPHRTFRGTLARDGLGGETTLRNNAVVLPARVHVADRDLLTLLEAMPVGVEVRAKIDCGRRSLGQVWFGDLWEFLCEHVLF